jgi:hypothetical protein
MAKGAKKKIKTKQHNRIPHLRTTKTSSKDTLKMSRFFLILLYDTILKSAKQQQ